MGSVCREKIEKKSRIRPKIFLAFFYAYIYIFRIIHVYIMCIYIVYLPNTYKWQRKYNSCTRKSSLPFVRIEKLWAMEYVKDNGAQLRHVSSGISFFFGLIFNFTRCEFIYRVRCSRYILDVGFIWWCNFIPPPSNV